MINVHFLLNFRPQSRRNFGEQVLNTFFTKTMAAIFDFNGSGRLGRERNLYQGGGRRSKKGEGWGWGNEEACPKSLSFCKTPFAQNGLIGAVKLQLSITSQMCHLSVILTFRSCGRKRKMANSDCKVISFHSALEEALKCLSEFNMSRALKSEQKEAISTLVCGRDVPVVLPTGFWKSLIFQVLVLMKEITTGNLRA